MTEQQQQWIHIHIYPLERFANQNESYCNSLASHKKEELLLIIIQRHQVAVRGYKVILFSPVIKNLRF